MKEFFLLKVITAINVLFATIGILIMGSTFNIPFVMDVMIWLCCIIIWTIFLLPLLKYDRGKSIRMLGLYYHELMEKIEYYEGKKYLMIGDILNKVLEKIVEIICIEKFDDTKILNDTNDKLPDHITLKIVVIWKTFAIKDSDKLYPKIF